MPRRTGQGRGVQIIQRHTVVLARAPARAARRSRSETTTHFPTRPPPLPLPPLHPAMAADYDPMTLTRFILTEQQRHPSAKGELSIVMSAIATAGKAVTSAVRRAGLLNLFGLQGSTNVTGDEQKKLDVIANDMWINALRHTKLVAVMVSEENDEAITYDLPDAKYVVAFDPLDGSSNIDCNCSIGSIFSITRRVVGAQAPSAADALQPGTAMIAAGGGGGGVGEVERGVGRELGWGVVGRGGGGGVVRARVWVGCGVRVRVRIVVG